MTEMEPRTRWSEVSGGPGAASAYQQRFDDLAARGMDIHGEAAFVAALVAPPVRVLDAGCGTGRVAIRLAELGYRVVGADVDASMLAEARRARPELSWLAADLATLPDPARLRQLAGIEPGDPPGFDLVVAAGNVIPLLAPGTLAGTVRRLAGVLAPGGLLVAGFGLDSAHLPAGCPVTSATDYLQAGAAAGLTELDRYGGWDGAPESAGYLVSVHRRPG